MTNDPEIQDIINQLQQLQIQQSALIERFEQLNEGNNTSEHSSTTFHTTSGSHQSTTGICDWRPGDYKKPKNRNHGMQR